MGKIVLLVGVRLVLLRTGAKCAASQRAERSRICKVNEPFAAAGDHIDDRDHHEQRWPSVLYIRHTTQSGRVFGAPMHVTRQPGHGTIEITVLEKGTRIAYRPNAAFVGEDEFSIINEMYNVDRPYKVTVVK